MLSFLSLYNRLVKAGLNNELASEIENLNADGMSRELKTLNTDKAAKEKQPYFYPKRMTTIKEFLHNLAK